MFFKNSFYNCKLKWKCFQLHMQKIRKCVLTQKYLKKLQKSLIQGEERRFGKQGSLHLDITVWNFTDPKIIIFTL